MLSGVLGRAVAVAFSAFVVCGLLYEARDLAHVHAEVIELGVQTQTATLAVFTKDGIDKSSAAAETFNIQNSGAGALTLQVDGDTVISQTAGDARYLLLGSNNTFTGLLLGPTVAAAAPTYAFSAASTTGMGRSASDTLAFSAGGAIRAEITSQGIQCEGLGTAAAPCIASASESGQNSGIFFAADQVSMSAGAAEAITALPTVVVFHAALKFHDVAPTSVTSGTCTSETLRAGGLESRGEVTATCTAQTWIVLFTTTYGAAPVCTVTSMNAAAAAGAATFAYTTSTTGLTATVTTATTTGVWAYHCEE